MNIIREIEFVYEQSYHNDIYNNKTNRVNPNSGASGCSLTFFHGEQDQKSNIYRYNSI